MSGKFVFALNNGSFEMFSTLFFLGINNKVNNNANSRLKMIKMRGKSNDLSKELEPAIHRGLYYFRDPKAETVSKLVKKSLVAVINSLKS
jgi:hypothetical protein